MDNLSYIHCSIPCFIEAIYKLGRQIESMLLRNNVEFLHRFYRYGKWSISPHCFGPTFSNISYSSAFIKVIVLKSISFQCTRRNWVHLSDLYLLWYCFIVSSRLFYTKIFFYLSSF